MEDRYLFKAKRIDNGEWEIGSLICLPNGEYEIANKCTNPPDSDPMWGKCVITHKVDHTTICQCTGLKDKNGKLIWENDIMKYQWDERTRIDVIKYDAPMFSYENVIRWSLHQDEVIGNIFDNPELL